MRKGILRSSIMEKSVNKLGCPFRAPKNIRRLGIDEAISYSTYPGKIGRGASRGRGWMTDSLGSGLRWGANDDTLRYAVAQGCFVQLAETSWRWLKSSSPNKNAADWSDRLARVIRWVGSQLGKVWSCKQGLGKWKQNRSFLFLPPSAQKTRALWEISVCICACLSVSASVSVCVFVFSCYSVFMSFCLCIDVSWSVVCLCVLTCVSAYVCVCTYVCVNESMCLCLMFLKCVRVDVALCKCQAMSLYLFSTVTLCITMYVYLSPSVRLRLSVGPSPFVSVRRSVCVSPSVCVCPPVRLCPSLHPSRRPFVFVRLFCVHLSICVCLSVRLCPSVRPFVFIRPSICVCPSVMRLMPSVRPSVCVCLSGACQLFVSNCRSTNVH